VVTANRNIRVKAKEQASSRGPNHHQSPPLFSFNRISTLNTYLWGKMASRGFSGETKVRTLVKRCRAGLALAGSLLPNLLRDAGVSLWLDSHFSCECGDWREFFRLFAVTRQ
jgi:hypothetical protein